VARALATKPALVIMDEPTGNLDAKNSANVLELIRKLREKNRHDLRDRTHDPNGGPGAGPRHSVSSTAGRRRRHPEEVGIREPVLCGALRLMAGGSFLSGHSWRTIMKAP